MAAGSKSGSAALMSGTSFSTALATRAVSQAMLTWLDRPDRTFEDAPGTEAWFAEKAAADEAHANWPGATVAEKAGAGRVAAPGTGRIPRDGGVAS
jgi:hypothetical protein